MKMHAAHLLAMPTSAQLLTMPTRTSALAPVNPNAAPAATPKDPKLVEAAKQFEAVFMRELLKPLEKSTAAMGGSSTSAGESTYGSMIVDALGDAVAKAGGLGFGDQLVKDLAPRLEAEEKSKATPSAPKSLSGAPTPIYKLSK
jgi:Rod binding domain-containing protein